MIVAAVNYLGVKPGSRLLNVFVILKTAALVLLIAAGLVMPGAGDAAAEVVRPQSPPLIIAFGAALIAIMFSYGGWQNLNYVAEEIRNPKRTLPLAVIAGTTVVVIVYVAVRSGKIACAPASEPGRR